NGKVWPYLEVEPRRYRFRILNASNSRSYSLKLSSGLPFHQIGNDGGLLPATVALTELFMAPAERADVIVDFSASAGAELILENTAPDGMSMPSPGHHAKRANPMTTGQVMQIRVNRPLSSPDTSAVPAKLPAVPEISPAGAAVVRDLALVEAKDPHVA